MTKKIGFTLAEVLITLTIIGVVAALTIPNVIQNYKKHEIETRLKQNYNLIQNAALMAQAEYGDIVSWTYDTSVAPTYLFNTYIAPYLKIVKQGRYTLDEFGYKTPIYYQDGRTVLFNTNLLGTKVLLADGTTFVCLNMKSATIGGKKYYYMLYMLFDLNGVKGPNTIGKDIFAYTWPVIKGEKPGFYPFTSELDIDTNTSEVYYLNKRESTHDELIEECLNSGYNQARVGQACGVLIMQNGWKIPDDYPLRF